VTFRSSRRVFCTALRPRLSTRRGREFHAGASGLGQADGNRLFRRSRAVLAFANMVNFLAHELTSLRRRPLSLPSRFPCLFDYSSLGHTLR
jgi:hypothetical protein